MRRLCRFSLVALVFGCIAMPLAGQRAGVPGVRQVVVPMTAAAAEGVPGASVINLDMKQAPAREVFAEVARQAGAQLRTYPKDLWESRGDEKLDVTLKDASLWSALFVAEVKIPAVSLPVAAEHRR